MKPHSGLLRQLLSDTYTPKSLAKLKKFLATHRTHNIKPIANGLFAASSSQAADAPSGYQNVWIRDNVMVADSFRRRGDTATAVSCMQGLSLFLATQLPRFRAITKDPSRQHRKDPQRRPHIRFSADTLTELPEVWPHAQNDALGQALWFRFVLANDGLFPFSASEYEIYREFPPYFEAIEYWHDRDSGAWEEGYKTNNSSVGAVLAGLEEMLKFHNSGSLDTPGVANSLSASDLKTLKSLIAKGRHRLETTLPFESPPERLADSALLLLIHPLHVLQSREDEDAVLSLVQARLRGDVGIRRYAGDSYFCQDYDEWFPPRQMSADFSDRLEYRDALLQPNCEAQWCLFDPLLSIIYGQRFLADRSDRGNLEKQLFYFNRSLAQLTDTGQCPELYFLKRGSYIPNSHTPLAWTQANQALALYLIEQSIGEEKR